MPMAVSGHEKSYESEVFAHWPPFPWFVGLLFKWLFFPKHKEWWRFAPCTPSMVRQELPFA
jgi:hypothetical protein